MQVDGRTGVSSLRRLAARGSLACLLLVLGTVVTSCSFLIDGNPDSCSADADCINHPGKPVCDVEAGICISPDDCSSTAECGEKEVCTFASPRKCMALTSKNCNAIYPDDPLVYRDDNALLIGLTAPLTDGVEASSMGVSVLNSAILAISEINGAAGANGQRKMVLVACDDTGDRNLAEANGQALADVGIQAILGPSFSGQTLDMTKGTDDDPEDPSDVVSPGTAARGVFNISPSATSSEITGIKDKAPSCATETDCPGLVWRTSPSDLIQGAAMVKYFPQLQALALNRLTPPRTQVKVVILHKGDSYGTNLSTYVYENLLVNGTLAISSPDVLNLDYGDTSKMATPKPNPEIIGTAIAFKADVYILIGTHELGTPLVASAEPGVMQQIEEGWADPEVGSKPYYLFADGGLIGEVANAATLTGARSRVRGTVPGTIALTPTDPIGLFTGRYLNKFPNDMIGSPTVFGAAGAYDAIYLMAYAVAAANNQPMTGEQFARGLLRTTSGEAIEVGQGQFGTANNILQNNGSINFIGASGPLDFDPVAGEAKSDIQIWCIGDDNAGRFSTLFYSAESESMKGNNDLGGVCPFPGT